MSKLHSSPPSARRPHASPSRAVVPSSRAFAPLFVAALALVALALCSSSLAARAQSGRRGQPKPAATPPPSPEPSPQGESESIPRGRSSTKPPDVVVSFVVLEYDSTFVGIDNRAREDVMDSFMHRLGEARAVSASFQGQGNRKDARDRAKAERDAYVVLFEIGGDMGGSGGIGESNTRTLVIKTYVYTPKTADLKFTDTIYQRPYHETARIGGIPVPVPSRRIEQYPSQLQLEQAARDSADRLMQRFGVTLPDN
jgi:hypothetical protein